ncbi:MAG: hypothetical protein IPN72_23720 [Saprospiraceae bacterium]|nr:hypothetical protein [Saprospiraceae bacterium]
MTKHTRNPKGKFKYNAGKCLGLQVAFMIGYPLGALIRGGEPNWALAGVGAGLVVVSIPIASSVKTCTNCGGYL